MTALSTGAFYERAINNLTTLRKQSETLQAQIATGEKVQHSYENAVAAAQLRTLSLANTMAEADTSNITVAKTQLTQTDDVLSEFADILSQVQTLTTQAASATLNDTQRAAIGTQLKGYYQNLVNLANTTDSYGHALFGGQGTGQAYSYNADGTVKYDGTGSAPDLTLGPGLSVTAGITGPEFLTTGSGSSSTNLLNAIKALGDTLAAGSGGSTTGTSALASAANAALTQLNSGMDSITTAQTVIGARLAWVNTTETMQTQMKTLRENQQSDIGGTDMTSAIARLQETMTVLEASQSSFVKLANLSLFSMLN
ncbi:flagellar biosynthesis protein FlgL [Novosphingobium sp. FSY-8]|uniref:Flagellar biosynthesis protein FlgL n=1 Tax=Novosphingobium ovatum TaxID=1908523 RepID=A0ABW9XGF6_9SPHN|nr:flagellar biosynthesis protein FlgL [Novosphingobium ovatum]NBC37502.1 flagellar biosynthesis protein FlgL [Novosphingobium ovatum]